MSNRSRLIIVVSSTSYFQKLVLRKAHWSKSLRIHSIYVKRKTEKNSSLVHLVTSALFIFIMKPAQISNILSNASPDELSFDMSPFYI